MNDIKKLFLLFLVLPLFNLACGPEAGNNSSLLEGLKPSADSQTFKKPIKEIKILSMDGGGIRGLMIANILKHFEETTKKPIHELFDIIAGTSTGGLLALALTTPNDTNTGPIMSAKEMEELYLTKSNEIFEKPFSFLSFLPSSPKYRITGIEKLIQQIGGNKLFKNALKPIIITAFDLEERKGYSLESDLEQFNNLSILDVGRSTSAAPTYFSPMMIQLKNKQGNFVKHYMTDGGLYKNNPALLGFYKAEKIFQNAEIQRRGIILISIGTGDFTAPRKYSFFGRNIERFIDLKFEISSHEDRDILLDIFKDLPNSRYIRIQPILDNKTHKKITKLDNVTQDNLKNLLDAAEAVKSSKEYKEAEELLKK